MKRYRRWTLMNGDKKRVEMLFYFPTGRLVSSKVREHSRPIFILSAPVSRPLLPSLLLQGAC